MLPARKLLYVSIGAAFSLAPWAAEATPPPPVFQGTVKCEGVYASGAKYGPVTYPVTATINATDFSGTMTVPERWGPLHNLTYRTRGFGVSPTPPSGTVGIGAAVDGDEGYYEAGQLKLKTNKLGVTKLEGDSIVSASHDTNVVTGPAISADCDWKLTLTPYGP